ncbi:MAG: hypothetical protein ACK5TN_10760 [Acidobacteriota bacterium]
MQWPKEYAISLNQKIKGRSKENSFALFSANHSDTLLPDSICRSVAAFVDQSESAITRTLYERCLRHLRRRERLQSRRRMIDFLA